MIPTRSDIFTVTGSPGEIAIDFGIVTGVVGDRDVNAALDTRIVLSPHIASRVATLLANMVRRHEAEFGPIAEGAPAGAGSAAPDILFDPVPGVSTEENADRALFLYRSIVQLGIPFAYERSFKLAAGAIFPNRFLCGVKKDFLKGEAGRILPELCAKLGMPASFLGAFSDGLPRANYVHFGFEEGARGCLYKVYLEFDVGLKPERPDLRTMPSEPFPLHLAFKWSPSDDSIAAISRYTGFPFQAKEEIAGRIADIYRGAPSRDSQEFTERIVDLAYGRLPNHGFFYMEVCEDGNPRLSFDVKVYEAKIPMREIFPLADGLRRRFGVADDVFLRLCGRIGDQTFGHVTGGVDRAGNEFLTLYYGVEWR